MLSDALYVYGIVKSKDELEWKEAGINRSDVYSVEEGEFKAIVHNCEEKPYLSTNPEEIKSLIVAHNNILDRAMISFGGVIPLPLNTIIKKRGSIYSYNIRLWTSTSNLKDWLKDNKEKLEKMWTKLNGKKEYGLRVYYEKIKLVKDASKYAEVNKIKENKKEGSKGLNYLLDRKAQYKADEIAHAELNKQRETFYNIVKGLADNVCLNVSRISVNEEKDLLLSLSILTNNPEIFEIEKALGEKAKDNFTFQFAGPFAPYSFVENETLQQ